MTTAEPDYIRNLETLCEARSQQLRIALKALASVAQAESLEQAKLLVDAAHKDLQK